MKEKEDQLIIRSSKESIYMCVRMLYACFPSFSM